MSTRRMLPKVLAVVALSSSGCSPAPGADAGCVLPSDFPPDADVSVVRFVCTCKESASFHCFEEGGPRCTSWACLLRKTQDGGYLAAADGGASCLC